MKIRRILPVIATLLIFGSCTQEIIGPVGPPGQDGLDAELAYVFEYEIDFRAPDYRVFLDYQGDFRALESDVALVYFLWEVENNGTEVWRPLPMTMFLNQGILQYSFDFTRDDVSVFMEATFPLNLVGRNLLDDWVVRVVVVPGLFGTNGRYLPPVDYNDYNAVKEYYNLKPTQKRLPGYSKG